MICRLCLYTVHYYYDICLICASDSMFYPLTMCALQIVFMIMINYIAKTYCSLRLLDKIKEIGHNDAKTEWPSDEDSGRGSLIFQFFSFTNIIIS